MNRRTQLRILRVGVIAVVLSIAVMAILAYAGTAPLGWSPPALAGPFTPFVVILAAALVGGLSVSRISSRFWISAGNRAGLSPESGGLFGSTRFTGIVHGRQVRVHLHLVSREKGSYTVVRALLDGPADNGAIVDFTGGRTDRAFAVAEQADVEVEGLAAVGGSRAIAEAVVTGRAGGALRDIDDPGQVFVGDASQAFEDLEKIGGSDAGDFDLRLDVEQHYRRDDEPTGEPLVDTASVTHVSRGQVLDSAEMRR